MNGHRSIGLGFAAAMMIGAASQAWPQAVGLGWQDAIVPGGKIGEFRHGTFPSLENRTHVGTDIVADCGTPIRAWKSGRVIDVVDKKSDPNFNSLGYMVMIDHAKPGDLQNDYSLYLHMKEAPKGQAKKAIIKGLELSQGDIIGMVGGTGAAQGCHLHFEIRKFASRFHPVWNNIYGTGDKRADPVFLRDWVDPGRLSVPRAITYDTVMVDPRGVLKGVVRLPPRSVILVDSVQCDKAALKSVSAIVPKGLKCYGQVIADGVPYLFYANWMRSLTEPGAMRVVVGGSRPQVLSDLAIVSDSVVGSIKVDDQHLEFLSVAPQPRYSEKLGHPYLRYRVVGNPGARRLQLLPSTMFAKGKSPLDLNKQQVIAASQPPAAAAPAAATAAAPQTNRTRQTYSAPVPQDSEPAGTSCGSVGRSGVITNLGDFFSCDEAAAIRAMQAGRKIVFKPSSVSFSNGKFVASMSQPSEKVLEARRRMAEGEARVRSSPPFSQKYNGNYWADWNTITQQTPFSIVCQFNTRQVVKNQEITVWAKLVNYSSRSAVLECS